MNLTIPTTTVPTQLFRDAVKRAAAVSAAKSSNPAVTLIHLRAKDGTLHVTSINGETCQTEMLETPDLPDLETAVRARDLLDVVKMEKGEALALGTKPAPTGTATDLAVHVSQPALTYTLCGGESIPPCAAPPTSKTKIEAGELLRALKAVGHALNKEGLQPFCRYVHIGTDEGKGFAWASDGYRVAYYEVDCPLPSARFTRRDADILMRLLRMADSEVISLHVEELWEAEKGKEPQVKRLVISGASFVLELPCAEAAIPNWKRVIPNAKMQMIWPRGKVVALLRGLSVLGAHNTHQRVELKLGVESISIEAESDYGAAEGEVALSDSAQVPTDIELLGQPLPFNAKYLLDALSHAPEANVEVAVEAEKAPIVIRAGKYLACVVTLRA